MLVSSFVPDVGSQNFSDFSHPASSPELAHVQSALSSSDPHFSSHLTSLWLRVGGSVYHRGSVVPLCMKLTAVSVPQRQS